MPSFEAYLHNKIQKQENNVIFMQLSVYNYMLQFPILGMVGSISGVK